MQIVVNFVAFQIGWFGSVMGASYGLFWLGPLVVAFVFGLHLYMVGNYRREITIGLLFMAAGFAVETLLIYFEVYSPRENLLPLPFCPPWLLIMWLNLATVFNVSLRWIHGKYRLAALIGGVGGPLAYYGGSALEALSFYKPMVLNLLITGAAWALVTPVLLFAVASLNERLTVDRQSVSLEQ